MGLHMLWLCPFRAFEAGGVALALGALFLSIRTTGRRQELGIALTRCWLFMTDTRVVGAAVLTGLLMLLPNLVLAQAASGGSTVGCSGTPLTNITGLDNLISTIWGYLMSGPVTKVLAAALFVYGLFGLFERRAAPLVFGFSGAFISAFAPTIIKAIFAGAQTGTVGLCG